jgi:DNA-binding Lrp family transcriptional regulator
MSSEAASAGVDEFNLLLMEILIKRPAISYKQIAETLEVDQRTVAKRIKALTAEGVLKQTIEIDWSKLGLRARAMVGSTTARGIDYARKLNELIESDPRIVEAYETLGSYHYFMEVIEEDAYKMRDSVLGDLDMLAAELTTSLVTRRVKYDYSALIRYLRETRFPRSRNRSIKVPSVPSTGEPSRR